MVLDHLKASEREGVIEVGKIWRFGEGISKWIKRCRCESSLCIWRGGDIDRVRKDTGGHMCIRMKYLERGRELKRSLEWREDILIKLNM